MSEISAKLQKWYDSHKRKLPWRNTNNPFHIWLSEIILQQTRVDQGLSYYYRFVENFPNISSLANANESEILKHWQGLGYYSRARNLHAAAKQIMDEHNGVFPSDYTDIIKLKGIGPYTAAAISSFAYQLPYAVLDGNVFRVLSRVFNEQTPINSSQGQKNFQSLANVILDHCNPGKHNQAIMELGALICTPKNPDCTKCPLQFHCEAYQKNNISALPVKINKTKIKKRYFNFLILLNENQIALTKRTEKDIWQHLYQPILFETSEACDFSELQKIKAFINKHSTITFHTEKTPHKLSHQHLYSQTALIENPNKLYEKGVIWVPLKKIKDFPVPRLVERIFASLKLI